MEAGAMRTRFEWTTGKVSFLYFCGVVLGSSLMLLGQAVVTGGSVAATLLGVVVAVMLPVLPVASAYKQGRALDLTDRQARRTS
jgi:uncharacterized membrane protein